MGTTGTNSRWAGLMLGPHRAGVQSWQWVDYVLLLLSLGRLCFCLWFVFLQMHPNVTFKLINYQVNELCGI